MSIQDVAADNWQLTLDFLPRREVRVRPMEEHVSTDAGLLPVRQFDERWSLTAGFARQLEDLRRPAWIGHTVLEMVRSRVYGILAGYEDQNDHDALRSDAIFKLLAGRLPDDADLASQPTLSRFENSLTASSLLRLEQWFLEQFVDHFTPQSGELTLDLDVFDDPTHGQQQLTFFHGFYDQYQYLVRVLTCAHNDQVILPVLLYGTARPTLGADDDVSRLVEAVRRRWPDLWIHLRADSGFGTPQLYETCESLRIHYTFGLIMNAVLKRRSEATLQQAVEQFQASGQPQRLFTAFEYQAASWSHPRWVVIKCEANAQGTNRRAVVTNRPGARVNPAAAYDEYADRGESENRNKELKCELAADRLSDHRYLANCFRMFLHCLAHNLLVRVRHVVACPPIPLPRGDQLPPEALHGRDRRRHFNHRRAADPLGEGHACTWRLLLIKVAARVRVTARRVYVHLSRAWPFLANYQHVGQHALATPIAFDTG